MPVYYGPAGTPAPPDRSGVPYAIGPGRGYFVEHPSGALARFVHFPGLGDYFLVREPGKGLSDKGFGGGFGDISHLSPAASFVRGLPALCVALGKDFLGSKDTVEGRWKPRIHRHLDHNFYYFLSGTANIEGPVNVDL